jgi:putative transposase
VWQYSNGTAGQGAVYQGRFSAIPVQNDRHFLIVCRYVERNALRASIVGRAEDWPFSSLWRRAQEGDVPWLSKWPVERPSNWIDHVNQPHTSGELEAIRRAVRLGLPFGDKAWRAAVDDARVPE